MRSRFALNSVLGFALLIGIIYVFFSFRSVMGLLPMPKHKTYQYMMEQVQAEFPEQTVRVVMRQDHGIQMYASYEDNREKNLETLNANGAKNLYRWVAYVNAKDGLTQTIKNYDLDGKLRSYQTGILQKTFYPKVSKEKAEQLAKQAALELGIDLSEWQQDGYHSDVAESGRVDQTFSYKMKKPIFSKAYQAVDLLITGDRVGSVSQYNKLPDDYQNKINSFYQIKSLISSIVMVAVIALIIMGIFSVNKLRKEGFAWVVSLKYLGVLALFTIGSHINYYHLGLVGQVPYLSESLLFFESVKSMISMTWFSLLTYVVMFVAAFSINQRIFPKRVAMSSWLTFNVFCNERNRKIVYIAYLSTLIFVIYQVIYYDICLNYFNFFMPSSLSQDINSDMYLIPFLAPMMQAFTPGLTEELIFRVIPIGGLLVLRPHLSSRGLYTIVFLQAIIFAAAHVSYPAEPFYARLIELFIPAVGFAWLYLRVDLMAAVLTHILFDCMWMGISNFTLANITLTQILYFIVFCLPLLLCLLGSLAKQKDVVLNEEERVTLIDYSLSDLAKYRPVNVLLIAIIAFFAALFITQKLDQKVISRSNLNYDQSIEMAKSYWKDTKFGSLDGWIHNSYAPPLDSNIAYFLESEVEGKFQNLVPRFYAVGCAMVLSVPADYLDLKGYHLKTIVCPGGVTFALSKWPYEASAIGALNDPEDIFSRYIKGVITPNDYQLSKLVLSSNKLPNRQVSYAEFALSQYNGVKLSGTHQLVASATANGTNLHDFSTRIDPSEKWDRDRHIETRWLGLANFSMHAKSTIFLVAILMLLLRFPLYLPKRNVFELITIALVLGGMGVVNSYKSGVVGNIMMGYSEKMALIISILNVFFSGVMVSFIYFLIRFSRQVVQAQSDNLKYQAYVGVLFGSIISLALAYGVKIMPYNILSQAGTSFSIMFSEYPVIQLIMLVVFGFLIKFLTLHFMVVARRYLSFLGFFIVVPTLITISNPLLSQIISVEATQVAIITSIFIGIITTFVFYGYGFVASLWAWLTQFVISLLVATGFCVQVIPALLVALIVMVYVTMPQLFRTPQPA